MSQMQKIDVVNINFLHHSPFLLFKDGTLGFRVSLDTLSDSLIMQMQKIVKGCGKQLQIGFIASPMGSIFLSI